MAYSAEVLRRARARLAMAKEDRESENREHLQNAYARIPRLKEIDRQLRATMAMAAQAVFASGGDVQSAMAVLGWMNGRNSLRLTWLMGDQHTGITWNGIDPSVYETDRRYNPADEYYDEFIKAQTELDRKLQEKRVFPAIDIPKQVFLELESLILEDPEGNNSAKNLQITEGTRRVVVENMRKAASGSGSRFSSLWEEYLWEATCSDNFRKDLL